MKIFLLLDFNPLQSDQNYTHFMLAKAKNRSFAQPINLYDNKIKQTLIFLSE